MSPAAGTPVTFYSREAKYPTGEQLPVRPDLNLFPAESDDDTLCAMCGHALGEHDESSWRAHAAAYAEMAAAADAKAGRDDVRRRASEELAEASSQLEDSPYAQLDLII